MITCYLIPACTTSGESARNIAIPSMVTSIGSADGDTSQQILTYRATLSNEGKDNVIISWIQPVLSSSLEQRLITQDCGILIDQSIASNHWIEVSGELTFDTTGLSKSEIAHQCFITGLTIDSESTISLAHYQKPA